MGGRCVPLCARLTHVSSGRTFIVAADAADRVLRLPGGFHALNRRRRPRRNFSSFFRSCASVIKFASSMRETMAARSFIASPAFRHAGRRARSRQGCASNRRRPPWRRPVGIDVTCTLGVKAPPSTSVTFFARSTLHARASEHLRLGANAADGIDHMARRQPISTHHLGQHGLEEHVVLAGD